METSAVFVASKLIDMVLCSHGQKGRISNENVEKYRKKIIPNVTSKMDEDEGSCSE
jgi:hypothetical protein